MVYDMWSETARVSISALGGSDVHFGVITETIDINMGTKDFDEIATLAGGRLKKFTPQSAAEVTFEAYPIEAGTVSGTTGTGFFDLMNVGDSSQPIAILADRSRNPYRVAIMWTDATSADAEDSVNGATNSALRLTFAGGLFTEVNPSFTDNGLKFTVKYKVPVFDKNGDANVKEESVTGSGTMPALGAYTTSNKF